MQHTSDLRRDAEVAAGAAVVSLRNGKTFCGHATVSGGSISMMDAKLRVRDLTGTRFYSPRAYSWPWHAVSRVTWTEAT